jgi:hypothetical protein
MENTDPICTQEKAKKMKKSIGMNLSALPQRGPLTLDETIDCSHGFNSQMGWISEVPVSLKCSN